MRGSADDASIQSTEKLNYSKLRRATNLLAPAEKKTLARACRFQSQYNIVTCSGLQGVLHIIISGLHYIAINPTAGGEMGIGAGRLLQRILYSPGM